jgi:hypothetical protein
MKTLFLDFDGVLHSMSDYLTKPFNRLPLIEDLADIGTLEIVISSSWRFHYELQQIKGRLGRLGACVVGTTGDAVRDTHARYREITNYVSDYRVSDWRALDDSHWEFPPATPELIICDPSEGVSAREVKALNDWLKV